MKTLSMRSLFAIALSIAISIILFSFVSRSPYIFGVGLVIGIYLADPSTMRAGAIYGAMISFPLSLYFMFTNMFKDNVANNVLISLFSIMEITVFGALYCAALVWIKNKIVGGTRFG